MTRGRTSSPVWRVSATSSAEAHADWLELRALFNKRPSSIEDLVSLLRSGGTVEELPGGLDAFDQGDEAVQGVAESALDIASVRERICGPAYPFNLSAQALLPKRLSRQAVYTFLLLLSTYGKGSAKGGEDGARLFEDIAGFALGRYIGGNGTKAGVYQFGFPRRITPAGFRDALDNVCAMMNEGGGSRGRPTRKYQKDAHLDIVAWIPMPDKNYGKLMMFGQCATGWDWESKLTELQAREWCEHWMNDTPPVIPVRTFHMPHTVTIDRWLEHARFGGIIFDRCRLAGFARGMPFSLRTRVKNWNYAVLSHMEAP